MPDMIDRTIRVGATEYTVDCVIWYERGRGPSYASGGEPEEWGIDEVTRLEDEDGVDCLPQYKTDEAFMAAIDAAIFERLSDD